MASSKTEKNVTESPKSTDSKEFIESTKSTALFQCVRVRVGAKQNEFRAELTAHLLRSFFKQEQ